MTCAAQLFLDRMVCSTFGVCPESGTVQTPPMPAHYYGLRRFHESSAIDYFSNSPDFVLSWSIFPCAITIMVRHHCSGSGMDWTQAGASPGAPGSLPSATWTQCGSTLAPGNYNGSAITSKLAGCPSNTYYLLGAGTFNINGSISMPGGGGGGHVALRGSGTVATKLSFSGSLSGCNGTGSAICMSGDGTYPGGPTTAYNWTSGYAQGSTQITLSSVSGIVLNQTLLVLNQCDTGFSGSDCTTGASVDNGNYFVCSVLYNPNNGQGCGANGPDTGAWRSNGFQQEIVTATAINAGGCGATCVTISHPLMHPNWASGQYPQAVLIQPVIQSGVENMTIDGLAGGSANQTAVGLQNALECWVSGVTISNFYEFGVYGLDVSHLTVQNNYFFHSNGHPDAYAIRPTVGDSDLIQNNIIQQWKNSIACDGPCVGEVVAYNFSVDQIVPNPSDMMWGVSWTHSPETISCFAKVMLATRPRMTMCMEPI